jgi:hypothetical protein
MAGRKLEVSKNHGGTRQYAAVSRRGQPLLLPAKLTTTVVVQNHARLAGVLQPAVNSECAQWVLSVWVHAWREDIKHEHKQRAPAQTAASSAELINKTAARTNSTKLLLHPLCDSTAGKAILSAGSPQQHMLSCFTTAIVYCVFSACICLVLQTLHGGMTSITQMNANGNMRTVSFSASVCDAQGRESMHSSSAAATTTATNAAAPCLW